MGVLDRGKRDKDNETGLKEGGGIEMSTAVLSIYTIARSLSFAFEIPYLLWKASVTPGRPELYAPPASPIQISGSSMPNDFEVVSMVV